MKSRFFALNRQVSIYLQGLSGRKPQVPVDPQALEEAARYRMSKAAFAYVAGGAGREETMARNLAGFRSWKITPRMLRDVSSADPSVSLLGLSLPFPLILAPVGVLEMAHPQGEIPVARAAADFGIPMIFSNQASVPMETCSAVMGDSPRWFQLYWSKDRRLVSSLVQRAEACGCSAIVLTLDTTMLGWRPRDLNLAYLPFLRGMGIAQYVSDPVFQQMLDEPDSENLVETPRRLTPEMIRSVISLMRNYPGGFWENLRSQRPLKAVRKFTNTYTNPALNWNDLSFLREQTTLPILLKGILHPQDAQKAVEAGMDGIIVSNHGGRQVDGAIGAIEALPDIASVINRQIPVLMDSGIRSGADVFKAVALGADAVCLGRPYVYGLALAGEAGVREVVENLLAEFELTMRLAGCRSIAEIREAGVERSG